MTQQIYIGGVAYICGGPYLYPSDEYVEHKKALTDDEFDVWLKRYREDFIRHFQFEKVYHSFNIYDEKIPNGYPIEDEEVFEEINRFEILDL